MIMTDSLKPITYVQGEAKTEKHGNLCGQSYYTWNSKLYFQSQQSGIYQTFHITSFT